MEAESAAVFQRSDSRCTFLPVKSERGRALSVRPKISQSLRENPEVNGDCGCKARTTAEIQFPRPHAQQKKHAQAQWKYRTQTSG